MDKYWCSARNMLWPNHHPEGCVHCLARERDWLKSHLNMDLVDRLKDMDKRIIDQRRELKRLNKQVIDAYDMVNRHERT